MSLTHCFLIVYDSNFHFEKNLAQNSTVKSRIKTGCGIIEATHWFVNHTLNIKEYTSCIIQSTLNPPSSL